MKRLLVGLVFVGLFLSTYAAFASDAGPADAGVVSVDAGAVVEASVDKAVELPEEAMDVAQVVWKHVMDGEWGPAVLFALMLVTMGLRWGADKLSFLKFFTSRLGGYILVFAGSTAGMLGTSAAADAAIDLKVVMTAVVFGFAAIGGWETVKDLFLKKKSEDVEEADEEKDSEE